MGALVLFGVPPEEYWPYTDKSPDFDIEPPAFCYAFAQNYQTISYLSLDPPGTARDILLRTVKAYLAAGIPSMFGFPVYESFYGSRTSGEIPFPCPNEDTRNGHIVVAIGYNDNKAIRNPNCDKETNGALLIRNSHGEHWGEAGYGWMPYEWVLKGLAVDWWTLLKSEWVDSDQFKS
jgi:C1A family cysteine protease